MNNTTNTAPACSCGCVEAHVIARRKTFDEISVQLWSDGAVTCGINTYVAMAPRTAFARANAVKAGWLVMDRVSLYDHSELRGLVMAARAAFEQTGLTPADYLAAKLRGVKFHREGRHGAVIAHASDCACATCGRRVYRAVTMSNGLTVNLRIN